MKRMWRRAATASVFPLWMAVRWIMLPFPCWHFSGILMWVREGSQERGEEKSNRDKTPSSLCAFIVMPNIKDQYPRLVFSWLMREKERKKRLLRRSDRLRCISFHLHSLCTYLNAFWSCVKKKKKVGAHNSVGSFRTLLRGFCRACFQWLRNGDRAMPCDFERVRKKRGSEWKRERFPSSPLALFMRAVGALMALIHEWKGEQKRGVEHKCTPRATPETTSQLVACTPLSFTTHGLFRVWDFTHLMMLWVQTFFGQCENSFSN